MITFFFIQDSLWDYQGYLKLELIESRPCKFQVRFWFSRVHSFQICNIKLIVLSSINAKNFLGQMEKIQGQYVWQ